MSPLRVDKSVTDEGVMKNLDPSRTFLFQSQFTYYNKESQELVDVTWKIPFRVLVKQSKVLGNKGGINFNPIGTN